MKLGKSKWFNAHGKIITWDHHVNLEFKAADDTKCYFVFTFVMDELGILDETESTALIAAGFCPEGVHRDGGSDTESTIPEEDQITDPTMGLPPVVMSEAWATTGPPGKGSGWLGIGPPIKVNQNYKTRCFEDGAGLCSPGRWRPGYRNLPDTEGAGSWIGQSLRHRLG